MEQLAAVLEVAAREQVDWRPRSLDCGLLERLMDPDGAPESEVTLIVQVRIDPMVTAEDGQATRVVVGRSPLIW